MPTIAPGGTLTLLATGTDVTAGGVPIDIVSAGGANIASFPFSGPSAGTTATLTNGWTFVYDNSSPPNFTLTAPNTATIQTGCEVRAYCYVAGAPTATPHSAFFDIGAVAVVARRFVPRPTLY